MIQTRLPFSDLLFLFVAVFLSGTAAADPLESAFHSPPPEARPGVYWYFMDGNLTAEGMTDDLESMKEAGIGNLVFLEVNVGVPRGTVDFLSEAWQDLFVHAVREAERLGIEITLGSGPGWAGSGGPWVKMEQSMQHLVGEAVDVEGPKRFDGTLPKPAPHDPFFGYGPMSPQMRRQHAKFYRDVCVLAFPTPAGDTRIADVDEKALVYRAPYSSQPGVKPYLPSLAEYPALPDGTVIDPRKVVDLSDRLESDGTLKWDIPPGRWTIMRFGARSTGATTRPAPQPGLGFECDKLDAAAFDAHFGEYVGKLLEKVGDRWKDVGWTMLHIDSWEMGAQNWTPRFREEFHRRRGYDPLVFLPTYTGRVVGGLEISERFLWDVRLTAQELVLENHAGRLKELAHEHGFGLSIEPYDMNPAADLDLGGVADVPMCEFWSEGHGFDSSYSCFEATSIAHTLGRPIVAAEAFTADSSEAWKLYPGAVKNQGDWAFCNGINRFVYHTFAHKPHGRRPGMTMGPYGVHWDRGQTWWPMAAAYHAYITRCQSVLRQGRAVADICYLAAEGAPHVFRPPSSATEGRGSLRDRKGYNFDGCSPNVLLEKASVRDGRIVMQGGAEYAILVLPAVETMTPELLEKVKSLVETGATVVGPPPKKSPSLVDYPRCDEAVAGLAAAVWGQGKFPVERVERSFDRGRIVWGGELVVAPPGTPVPRAIEGARWIWTPEGNAAASAEPCERYFRRTFRIAEDRKIEAARLEATVDNTMEVWINGEPVLTGSNFHRVETADVADVLRRGENIVAVRAVNDGPGANPAGLIACLRVTYADGAEERLFTDATWNTAETVGKGWRTAANPTGTWTAAKDLGPVGMDPWRLNPQSDPCPDLYPSYDATARLLHDMGIAPDFESDGPIRYTHRRTDEADVYFVSNRQPRMVEAACTFRVAGRRPELWNPVDATTRDLPDFREVDGRTTVPLRFEPHESYFVVFRSEAGEEPPGGTAKRNFPQWKTLGLIEGPWDVSFDPKMGAPQRATFEMLDDWTARSEPGIRHYSGIATYRKTFDAPAAADGRVVLDLGTVHNLARVRLNGRDLGVVWCAPWRVEVTDAVIARGNQLEIEVANLWPNRLIGDQDVPENERVTWTTFNPYKADSPLLPSGLIGPVTLKQEEP